MHPGFLTPVTNTSAKYLQVKTQTIKFRLEKSKLSETMFLKSEILKTGM
jgi:hypothetical protein